LETWATGRTHLLLGREPSPPGRHAGAIEPLSTTVKGDRRKDGFYDRAIQVAQDVLGITNQTDLFHTMARALGIN
jgi:hypothetical protein